MGAIIGEIDPGGQCRESESEERKEDEANDTRITKHQIHHANSQKFMKTLCKKYYYGET